MQLSDVINEPEIQNFKSALEYKNYNFEETVSVALDKAKERIYMPSNPDKSEMIAFIADFLLKLVSDNVKPKRKGWRIFWDVVLLGIPLLIRKKQ